MNKNRIVLRILAMPFISCLIILSFAYGALKRICLIARWGGEFVDFDKNTKDSVKQIITTFEDTNQIKP